jgi:hypothetical protein
MGILPESMHPAINKELLPVIDEILAEARELVVSYQRSVDDELLALTQENSRRDSFNFRAALSLYSHRRPISYS